MILVMSSKLRKNAVFDDIIIHHVHLRRNGAHGLASKMPKKAVFVAIFSFELFLPKPAGTANCTAESNEPTYARKQEAQPPPPPRRYSGR